MLYNIYIYERETIISIIQLNLLGELIRDEVNNEVDENNLNTKNTYIEATVIAYRILDKLTNRSYIGVSIEPATSLPILDNF